MKAKIAGYWSKTKNLRNSMPNFITNNVFGPLEDPEFPKESLSEQINRKLLRYKELKAVYNKTGIQPCYLVYILIIFLIFIFIGFFDKYLTIFIATSYPLYISLKTLQHRVGEEKPDGGTYTEEEKKHDITQWLTYWVVYSLFINFEGMFGFLLKYIPFYFFIKVIFLLLCFLPQYQLAGWIYSNCLSSLFKKYETHIINISNKIVRKLTAQQEIETNFPFKQKPQKSKTISVRPVSLNKSVNKRYPTEEDLQEEEKVHLTEESQKPEEVEKLDDSGIFENDPDE